MEKKVFKNRSSITCGRKPLIKFEMTDKTYTTF